MSNKTLKRGDQWATKDRLWAVVDSVTGRIERFDGDLFVFATRRDALRHCGSDQRIVRLSDLTGVVQ